MQFTFRWLKSNKCIATEKTRLGIQNLW